MKSIRGCVRLPRGIPAASLKRLVVDSFQLTRNKSSAGNTRGLIEAHVRATPQTRSRVSLPRGIPAASLKRLHPGPRERSGRRLPRGIPAASLKHRADRRDLGVREVFRGEYPRPH